ncbi:MAG TPA: 2-dehydropantoate 2-reductase N-terminal domain-containing protein, partial [Hyphomicrobiaceae bacterium]|nr:2-dehydropantoate 2-reductase N-terminal domain-containing protein [Hyphomicrobiaceae bacterium]
MSPRLAIVGAGALGGHVGGYLAKARRDVTLIDAWPEHVEAMRAKGLTLAGLTADENFTTKVRALHITDVQGEAKRPFDVVFIAVKSYDTLWAAAMMLDYVAPGGFFVSLQNGINEERLASVVGWGRTLGCIASTISVELTGPAQIQRNVMKGGAKHTVFRVGEPHGRITARAKLVTELVSAADSAK